MVKVTDEYVAFGALLIISGTGLAMIVVGACLLSWAAYLSPWMPSWVWMSVTAFTALGVAVAAASTAAAIATVAPKPQAAHKCLVFLLIFLGIEIAISALGAVRQPVWSVQLYHQVQQTMTDSLEVYSKNASSAAMWDEIQTEVSCCGVQGYSDWFESFGDGYSVPDACCLLPAPGCGQSVRNRADIEDTIDTEGCLPTLASSWTKSYRMLTRRALLPICIIQVIMVTVIVLTYRRAGLLTGHLPMRVARHPPAPVSLPRLPKGDSAPSQYSLMA